MLGLVAVWLIRPTAAPPLYDGIPLPSQYRYLSPPANYDNRPPQVAHAVISVPAGGSPRIDVSTGDGQARLQADAGVLAVPAGADRLSVDIVAVPAPAARPSPGQVDGNVYLVSLTAAGAAVRPAPGRSVTVTLAATGTLSGESLQAYAAATGWTTLATRDLGSLLFAAPVTDLGEIAVVASGGATEGVASVAAVLVSTLLAVGLVVIGVLSMTRRSRRPRRPTAPRGSR